ncbi:hypothetical protein JW823_00465 [bacterium]|nr:hypothetical protein [candidate division CSSED10-310 bacterium]
MSRRLLSWLIVTMLVTCPAGIQAAIQELANDAWQPEDAANYQAGFVTGEIMASTFSVSTTEYPFDVMAVRVLVGDGTMGGTTSSQFLCHIWEDSGGESPGEELATPFTVLLTAGAINEIDMTGLGLDPILSGSVRVGLEFLQDPPPSFFSDDDGFITQHVNTLFDINFGWRYSEFFGLTGDWILRLLVNTTDPTPTATSTGTLPTYTPPPTYTPFPTSTPYPTYSPLPTFTPPPSATPLPTYTPAPTCTSCPTQQPGTGLSLLLWMPSHHFTPGQPFLVNALVGNSNQTEIESRFMTVLLMAGGTWFYPTWQTTIDSELRTFAQGDTVVSILPEFTWPSGAGSVDNVMFVAAITSLDYQQILTTPDIWIWSFSE